MLTLYDFLPSGNGYKVRLTLALLGRPYRLIEKNILKGETRTPEFLKINANGRIPTLVLDDGTALAESNAIIFFLARDTALWPAEKLDQAKALQWMFFEQYSHEPYVAVLRAYRHVGFTVTPEVEARMPELERRSYQALGVMEEHLVKAPFFAGSKLSIADIALFAYTHVAEQGGLELSRFPAIQSWIERVEATPHFVPITYRPKD